MAHAHKAVAVFFGGFWPPDESTFPGAYASWVATRGSLDDCILNLASKDQDSLLDRWRRAERALEHYRDEPVHLYILAYSMGCHVALKCAETPRRESRNKVLIKSVDLIAPDPKFIETELDRYDERVHGIASPYQQACSLWGPTEVPGEAFVSALKRLPLARVVCSRRDTVAPWTTSAKRLHEGSGENTKWAHVPIGESVQFDGVCTCHLDPSQARHEHWIHEQLFTNTIFLPTRGQDS